MARVPIRECDTQPSLGFWEWREWPTLPYKSFQALAREKEPLAKVREDSKLPVLGSWETEW